MPTKSESNLERRVMYAQTLGIDDKCYVELGPIQSATLTTDTEENIIFENNRKFIEDLRKDFSGSIVFYPSRMTRKRFKKLMMAKGISRNEVEKSLDIIVKNKASYWYTYFMFNLGFGGASNEIHKNGSVL